MSTARQVYNKRCQLCGSTYETTRLDQMFCSRSCSNRARRGIKPSNRPKKQPVIADIRIKHRLPVNPEFELIPGAVYRAEKSKANCNPAPFYVVRHADGKATVVRFDECEEV